MQTSPFQYVTAYHVPTNKQRYDMFQKMQMLLKTFHEFIRFFMNFLFSLIPGARLPDR